MDITSSNELQQLEDWLYVLINTYKDTPSDGLAKVIFYYLERILSHQDLHNLRDKSCHYFMMKKFWLWQCNKT